MKRLRKIACHQIVSEEGPSLRLAVVEIADGVVVQYYPLDGEQAQTEWLAGTIHLKRNAEGQLKAYYDEKEL